MNNPCESGSRFGKEEGRVTGYRWSRREVVSAANELLRTDGSRARREIVRTTLELHRLLAGKSNKACL